MKKRVCRCKPAYVNSAGFFTDKIKNKHMVRVGTIICDTCLEIERKRKIRMDNTISLKDFCEYE